jgi:hypothetical protein
MNFETCTFMDYAVIVKLKLIDVSGVGEQISIWFLDFVYRTILEGYLCFFMRVISGPSKYAYVL